MEETRIRSPNVGAAHTLTSNLPLDALGPGNATEGTDPSNDGRSGGGGREGKHEREGGLHGVGGPVGSVRSLADAPPIADCSISIAYPWDGTIVPPLLDSSGFGRPGGIIRRARVRQR